MGDHLGLRERVVVGRTAIDKVVLVPARGKAHGWRPAARRVLRKGHSDHRARGVDLRIR